MECVQIQRRTDPCQKLGGWGGGGGAVKGLIEAMFNVFFDSKGNLFNFYLS